MNYYDTHADDFISGSLNADMQPVYDEFLPLIISGGRILDAGCGSGRDSKYFISKGYQVDAFDLSEEMVKFATELTGIAVEQKSFADLDLVNAYDGVWACASLLHVPNEILAQCMENSINSLISGGIMYCSFKYGETNMSDQHNRRFTNMTEQTIRNYLPTSSKIVKMWTNEDVRQDRTQKWLNALIKKVE